MKKLFVLLIAALCLISGALPIWAEPLQRAVFTLGDRQYSVNKNTYTMDAAPFIEENRIFVPIRYLAYACGVSEQDVLWSDAFETVTLKKDATTLQLQVGIDQAIRNGRVEELDVAPIYRSGRTYLPARWIGEGLGYQVKWDEKDKTVTIEK